MSAVFVITAIYFSITLQMVIDGRYHCPIALQDDAVGLTLRVITIPKLNNKELGCSEKNFECADV